MLFSGLHYFDQIVGHFPGPVGNMFNGAECINEYQPGFRGALPLGKAVSMVFAKGVFRTPDIFGKSGEGVLFFLGKPTLIKGSKRHGKHATGIVVKRAQFFLGFCGKIAAAPFAVFVEVEHALAFVSYALKLSGAYDACTQFVSALACKPFAHDGGGIFADCRINAVEAVFQLDDMLFFFFPAFKNKSAERSMRLHTTLPICWHS